MQTFQVVIAILSLNFLTSCNGQNVPPTQIQSKSHTKLVGGRCDGCELMFEGMPDEIKSIDYSPGWSEEGQKLLITGTVYKLDGKTPAPNVIVYYWQTDNNGYYSPKDGMSEKAKRHGYIRGWIKSDTNGKYSLYTIRPAPYPKQNILAHIHLSIKEPTIDNAYYVDELVFDDDQLLTEKERKAFKNRGGSGILRVSMSSDMQIAEHDIILGLNISNYPVDHR